MRVLPLQMKKESMDKYDIVVASVGYESRARFAATALMPRAAKLVAFGYLDRQELFYIENRDWFIKNGYEICEVEGNVFQSVCENRIAKWLSERMMVQGGAARIMIDISSMTRKRMAVLVDICRTLVDSGRLYADFVYAPALYGEPSSMGNLIERVEPVLSEFDGAANDPEQELVAFVGLGFERDLAIGAMEFLEPSAVRVFRPVGGPVEYQQAVEEANELLWDVFPKEKVVDYDVTKPWECFAVLEAMAYGALQMGRLMIVPFGPKIFALLSLLVAVVHEEVAVWRVTPGELAPSTERTASGEIISLRVLF